LDAGAFTAAVPPEGEKAFAGTICRLTSMFAVISIFNFLPSTSTRNQSGAQAAALHTLARTPPPPFFLTVAADVSRL
jgi:hypothetical protein